MAWNISCLSTCCDFAVFSPILVPFLNCMNLGFLALVSCFGYVSDIGIIADIIFYVLLGGMEFSALLDEDGSSSNNFCLHSGSATFCDIRSLSYLDAILSIRLPARKVILTNGTFLHINWVLSDEMLRIL